MIEIIAAIIVVFAFGVMSVFQFLIVVGLPLGHLAYGGKYDHEKLPRNFRIMSVVAIGIFIFGSIVVLERVALINLFNNPWVPFVACWILAIYFTLGVLMNFASKSKCEKRIMTPIALLFAVCMYIVAILG